MLWKTLLYTVRICCYDWFNKYTDSLLAIQDKVRQESQNENDGKKEGQSEESPVRHANGIEVKGIHKHLGSTSIIEMGYKG